RSPKTIAGPCSPPAPSPPWHEVQRLSKCCRPGSGSWAIAMPVKSSAASNFIEWVGYSVEYRELEVGFTRKSWCRCEKKRLRTHFGGASTKVAGRDSISDCYNLERDRCLRYSNGTGAKNERIYKSYARFIIGHSAPRRLLLVCFTEPAKDRIRSSGAKREQHDYEQYLAS